MSLRHGEPGPAEPTGATLTQAKARLRLVASAFVLAFGAVSLRLLDVAVLDGPGGDKLVRAAAEARVDPARADIVDRDGHVLARTVPTRGLYANPQRILDPRRAAAEIHRVLDALNRTRLADKLRGDGRFVWLKRDVTPKQERALLRAGIAGIGFRDTQQRVYPGGELAAHVLGGTDIDGNGIAGVEAAFDNRLDKAQKPLRLTLDRAVQGATRQALQNGIERYNAKGGAAVVMDVQSQAIRALVSLPGFDPHRPGEASAYARRNRASLSVYEVGSTMKLVTAALALNSGTVELADRFAVSEPLQVGGFRITDTHPKDRPLTVPEIIMYSSNIGAAKIAQAAGERTLRSYLRRLGLTKPVPFALPASGAPLLPDIWRPINTVTAAYGHGISVTPLHMASAVATLVNGGRRGVPHLRAGQAASPQAGERVVSARTSRQIRRLMRLVVAQGTGAQASVNGYVVGGKTGTARKAQAGGYGSKLRTSFVAAFPMHRPRYIVFAMLDEPQAGPHTHGFATAGWNVAEVTGKIIARTGPILGVEPVAADAREVAERLRLELLPRRQLRPRRVPEEPARRAALDKPGGGHARL